MKKCEDCGKEVSKGDIHHKNRVHSDNSPENRVFLCKSCHGRIHGYDSSQEDFGVKFGDSYDQLTNKAQFSQRLKYGFDLLQGKS